MAGRIPDQFIDDLLARVDIVELIESYLPLRKAGREYQALCPFHGEKTPSFTISREKQFYHCFGCGAHGSAIGFLMNYRSLEFPEAVEELAALAGLEVPREAQRPRASGSRELLDLLQQARAYFEGQLRHHPARERAVTYLKDRGVSGEIAKAFRLGFAPDGWRNLLDAMSASGVDEGRLERAGLAIRRDGGSCYDRFRDRIMFPIHDRRGRVIGFGGRVIAGGDPKYLNSPESEVFHKGRELYGLHEALVADKRLTRLMVVEGYLDVISLHQFGASNAVATLGTAVTRDHLELLFRQAAEVVFCFDGDAAGRRAAWKALESSLPFMEGNRQVRFTFLPEGHDPDSAVRAFGRDALFKTSQNFGLTDYLLEVLKAEFDLSQGDGRARLLARAKPLLLQIPGEGHRAAAVQALAALTRFDENLLRQELGFAPIRAVRGRRPPALQRFTSRSLEERALAMLLQRPDLAERLTTAAADFLRAELDDAGLLLEVWATVRALPAATSATVLERWRDHAHEAQLAALAALDLNLSATAMEAEFSDALARLAEKAEERRFGRINAIPFEQWTSEQREIVRRYKRVT